MDSGYFAAMAGLVARTEAVDLAAANLANADTPGYRAERDFFRSFLLSPNEQSSQLDQTLNSFGALAGDRLDMSQGPLSATGNPLDLAIAGEGFFKLQTGTGPRFTRNGGFHRSTAGLIVSSDGDPVLSAQGKVLRVPPGEISIGVDGAVSVGGEVVAAIGIFTFPRDAQLSADGKSRYRLPDPDRAENTTKASIQQGFLESSNQDVIQSSLEMITMQRQAEMMQRALTMFHTEFNKIASEDLPRV